ncbi:bifunctional glutamate N-acetyltransferase/amino-acid acetyltransferase ArgJ [Sandaracinus amylolyticus]|uniref:bifunctional glutamate N-acetyltransferase/amino-acid acetyltransferase ArgJ n=1 Tax=Sandaracinus amylolyticus TaxID=927083 RepID=UPI001F025D68|nr:bifunctional glutamate N-acetyltransferase/amino-acid acetyltransferase ArgJ [Sandaracinus amylolyticus]UJR80193.1 Arginine biosynthesis bifunctional protein ArgJ [Sandaracinus amylolyticus]
MATTRRTPAPISIDVTDRPLPVPGFRLAGISAGIKANDRPDLALIVADEPVSVAGVFTKNRVQAAPVRVAKERAKAGKARAVLVNSGNANACTGKAGLDATKRTTEAVAERLGVSAKAVLPASTGVIGAVLPAETIVRASDRLIEALSIDGGADFARAIMTTDQWPKVACAQVRLGRETATVLGIAKGAGMIHPDMATTLGFVISDAGASPALLKKLLKAAIDPTFNAVSVDGDTSTNDTVLLMASGKAGSVRPGSKEAATLQAALTEVLGALAKSIVRDGEGARHVARIEVEGLANDRAARTVARTIATSPLVKTALHGRDANWGRILAAAGRAGVAFDPDRAEIRIGDETIVRGGMPVGKDAEARAATILQGAEYTIRVTLGKGRGRAHYLTCDLGPDYVAVNANYRS